MSASFVGIPAGGDAPMLLNIDRVRTFEVVDRENHSGQHVIVITFDNGQQRLVPCWGTPEGVVGDITAALKVAREAS